MEWSLENLDFRSIRRDILKNIWAVVLVIIAAYYGITGLYALRYKPEYTSSAILAVNMKGKNGSAYNSLYMTKDMAGIFSEVFQSEALRNKIAESLGADSIDGRISISLISETNLMQLNVVSASPKDAYLIIEAALDNYETISDYLFSNARLDILKAPSLPQTPSNPPNVARIRKIAMLAGAGLTIALIILLSFMRATVKKEKTAKHQLDGKIIGTIPYIKKRRNSSKKGKTGSFSLKKKKTALLITSFRVGVPFAEAIKKIATNLERHMRRHGEKVLAVTSVAENEGKSSVTVNIALALAEREYRILLIDADLKKPAVYRIFDKKKEKDNSLTDFIAGRKSLNKVMKEEPSGLTVIYQYTSTPNSGSVLNRWDIEAFLDQCREEFDYILIDTAPMGVSSDTEKLLQHVDATVITVREDRVEVGVINDAADTVRRTEKDFAGFILNAFHSSSLSLAGSRTYGYSDGSGKMRESRG